MDKEDLQHAIANNPYESMSEETYVSMKIKDLAQLACGCVCSAVESDQEKAQKLLEENWQNYLPVVKYHMWAVDIVEKEENGGLQ